MEPAGEEGGAARPPTAALARSVVIARMLFILNKDGVIVASTGGELAMVI